MHESWFFIFFETFNPHFVVFANFDGKTKHKTVVGDNCFLGCNSNLVAPLCIGDDCFVAAGTTVTKDVGAHSFVIGRARQTAKDL